MKTTKTWRALLLASLTVATSAVGILVAPEASAVPTWVTGDVFVATNNGKFLNPQYKVYDNNGNLKDTISDGLTGVTTGCAFNTSQSKLYTTNLPQNNVEVYDTTSHNLVQTINTTSSLNESVVFAGNGDFYVSHAGIGGGIDHYNPAGTLLATLAAGVRTDWMDLAADQKTMFFTDEGNTIRRWDVSTNSALPNFATVPTGMAYALRLLPPGDGSGGLLVAAGTSVLRLRPDGSVAQTYNNPTTGGLPLS